VPGHAQIGKRKDYYDTAVKELLIQVTSNGTKTFYVRRKVSGVSNRIKIGRYPAISVENARKKAREILGDIERGVNPQDVKRAEREELTLGELFEHFDALLHIGHPVAAGAFERWQADRRKCNDQIGLTMGREGGAKGRRH